MANKKTGATILLRFKKLKLLTELYRGRSRTPSPPNHHQKVTPSRAVEEPDFSTLSLVDAYEEDPFIEKPSNSQLALIETIETGNNIASTSSKPQSPTAIQSMLQNHLLACIAKVSLHPESIEANKLWRLRDVRVYLNIECVMPTPIFPSRDFCVSGAS